MKAAKLYGANDIRVIDCPVPEINEDEILLKTSACSICGTDIRMITNGFTGVDEQHPLTLGHEFSGVIVKAGANVSGYKEGMHVSVAPNIGCGICDMCVSGNPHLCKEFQALGINTDGGFAEYIRIPKEAIILGNVMILDEKVPLETASVFEPMSCVLNGQERVQIEVNDTVLIIGAGPIGIMHALLAKISGASRIFIRDLSVERMRQCVAIEPSITAVEGDDLTEEIMKLTNRKGVDVCITACPSAVAQKDALQVAAQNGKLLYFGGLPAGKDKVEISTNQIHYKQLKICGSTRCNTRQYREVAKMVSAGTLDLSSIVSREYTIEQFAEAVSYARSAKGLKTIIKF
jgi:L-iditol 2-dehydrogenase